MPWGLRGSPTVFSGKAKCLGKTHEVDSLSNTLIHRTSRWYLLGSSMVDGVPCRDRIAQCACQNEGLSLHGRSTKQSFSHCPGGWKSETKVSARVFLLTEAICLLTLHVTARLCPRFFLQGPQAFMASCEPYLLFKNPVSKHGPILRYWAIRTSTYDQGDTMQTITSNCIFFFQFIVIFGFLKSESQTLVSPTSV